ncbi:RodZ domain-containing protein [Moritella sp. F3]|uniref:RodZ domain-containing protein n=1 Tax=Moritella sp. F3 TaxID=2718882 RepID=UPI0018E0F69B|nr:RodZ domain-containing protein [Moritella sp. F3]GIC76403.1 XRE family transcriptional regulator [Moritella sp. F1]GIC80928.1 XRE family transcriptional regulator [Moritella sp. F3]
MTIDLETSKEAEKQDDIDVITAGQILRDARIALDISVQQVSDNINLKKSVINNIEESVIDKDISQTFMRGYIRCYARYLNIAEDDVLCAYDSQNAACEDKAELQSFSRRTKLEANDNRLMLVSYGIIGFMLIVFLIWGLRGNDIEIVVPESNATPVVELAVVPEIVVTAPEIALENDEVTNEDMANDEVIPAITAPEQTATTTIASPSAVQAQTIAVKQPAVAPVASNTVTKVVDTKSVVIEPSLVLTFAGDCWIQIKDSNGKTLSTGVRKAGQTIELQGLAPLSIKLGAPEQVTLSYAGDPVDLSTFKQGRLAKFKLPFKA